MNIAGLTRAEYFDDIEFHITAKLFFVLDTLKSLIFGYLFAQIANPLLIGGLHHKTSLQLSDKIPHRRIHILHQVLLGLCIHQRVPLFNQFGQAALEIAVFSNVFVFELIYRFLELYLSTYSPITTYGRCPAELLHPFRTYELPGIGEGVPLSPMPGGRLRHGSIDIRRILDGLGTSGKLSEQL